uniref:phosphonate C-P lyase system protein PhnL n=1 Tax=Marinobacterium profundum TaxID=1714300 RepID=UPI00083415EA|nr:phosphonate C-P lyase system protein PhnL [Marinobacterium profundum]
MNTMIKLEGLSKTFTLHNQQGTRLEVLQGVDLSVQAGECVVLHGESGAGKSTLLRTLYANYLPSCGSLQVRHDGELLDLTRASSRELLQVRRRTLGYVSQFLRVIPRVSTLDVVMQPLRELGIPREQCEVRALALLRRLNVPERLWSLAPGTFSGGEQQRVNIARGFIVEYPILLLDEPTASLDARNAEVVVQLIAAARDRGAAIVGIFHDQTARHAVADRLFDLRRPAA